jgi:hypothetical protein
VGFVSRDAVRIAPLARQFLSVDAAGATEPVQRIEQSYSSPVISVDQHVVSSVSSGPGPKDLYANLFLSGTVDGDVLDLNPGLDGTIDALQVFVNDEEQPSLFLPVTYTKPSQADPAHVLAPFDYEGTFERTLVQVPLRPGPNSVELRATDRVYGQSGFARFTFDLDLAQPIVQVFDFEVTLAGDLSVTAPDTVTTRLAQDGGPFDAQTLVETGPDTKVFSNSAGTFSIALVAPASLNAGAIDQVTATVSSSAFDLHDLDFVASETGAGSRSFTREAERTIDPQRLEDFSGRAFTFRNLSPVTSSSGGEFNPYLYQLVAPDPVFADGASGVRTVVLNGQEWPYMELNGRRVLAERDSTPEQRRPAILELRQRLEQGEVGQLHNFKEAAEYAGGVAVGFLQGGWKLVSGTAELLWDHSGPVTLYKLVTGKFVEEVKHNYEVGSELAKTLGAVELRIMQKEAGAMEAVLSGSDAELNKLSKELRLAMAATADFFAELAVEVIDLSPYEKGKIAGRATFEIVAAVVPLSELGQLSKLKLLKKLDELELFRADTRVGRAWVRTRKLIERIEAAASLAGPRAVDADLIPAGSANARWLEYYAKFTPDPKPPYPPGSVVVQVILGRPTSRGEFVRLYRAEDGNMVRHWIVRKDAITRADGTFLSPAEIKVKLSLTEEPTHVVDVLIPKGEKVNIGPVKRNFDGTEGETQFEFGRAIETLKEDWFRFARELEDGGT